ncbi:hypothetical protein [Nostoc sphaeroides]|uniref:Multidrug efflux pump subunit AcrB n=1 Tax=Nostoc sphaeroides CCNUC1 TaxID=2653204 RepID=A0A5P8VW74_9NOSO|nr:hypothetical protein [Nostoc sphaeroides]MCC5629003.1 hypothetical protein [Nostoc sphaeroides CHAB 2801]QFS44386.1 Multidrug efflux pump subunit AcrB [Nostoc sphaeroides CCNUC1]
MLIGFSQEMIRELKQEQDAEKNLLRDLNKAIHLSTDKTMTDLLVKHITL